MDTLVAQNRLLLAQVKRLTLHVSSLEDSIRELQNKVDKPRNGLKRASYKPKKSKDPNSLTVETAIQENVDSYPLTGYVNVEKALDLIQIQNTRLNAEESYKVYVNIRKAATSSWRDVFSKHDTDYIAFKDVDTSDILKVKGAITDMALKYDVDLSDLQFLVRSILYRSYRSLRRMIERALAHDPTSWGVKESDKIVQKKKSAQELDVLDDEYFNSTENRGPLKWDEDIPTHPAVLEQDLEELKI
ncbi:hypothetical protein BY458DRAFT_557169 [Sporodiniella umbellata]|nr:hypothetical protein BY458DRAFT_557169 [Sporodiniella umbellata]